MSKARALRYIDTLQGYLAPRIAVSLGLTASVGVKNLDLSSVVKVYPVPASDFVTISNTSTHAMQHITLRDINGRTLATKAVIGNSLQLPLNVPSGVYFLNIQFDNGTATKKLIVE